MSNRKTYFTYWIHVTRHKQNAIVATTGIAFYQYHMLSKPLNTEMSKWYSQARENNTHTYEHIFRNLYDSLHWISPSTLQSAHQQSSSWVNTDSCWPIAIRTNPYNTETTKKHPKHCVLQQLIQWVKSKNNEFKFMLHVRSDPFYCVHGVRSFYLYKVHSRWAITGHTIVEKQIHSENHLESNLHCNYISHLQLPN